MRCYFIDMEQQKIGSIMKRDILEAFFNSLSRMNESSGYVEVRDVIDDAFLQHAPRFYISAEKAQWYVSLLNRGMDIPVVLESKRAMYEEIYRRWRKLGNDNDHSIEIFERIILQPAPCFYVTKKTFRKLIYEARREKMKRK